MVVKILPCLFGVLLVSQIAEQARVRDRDAKSLRDNPDQADNSNDAPATPVNKINRQPIEPEEGGRKLPSKPHKGQWNHIAKFPNCQDDISKYCAEEATRSDFELLSCLKGDPNKPHDISKPCQDSLFDFQLNLTKGEFFNKFGQDTCGADMQSIEGCSDANVVEEMGGPLFCLLEHKMSVKRKKCIDFLNAVGRLVFVDYARMKPFLTDCGADISSLHCGRTPVDGNVENGTQHRQGPTLDCLAEHLSKLSPQCKRRMLLVAEMQSDDFHLDRSLFFACRMARETFCKDVVAGEGRVLKCLMMKKMDTAMPEACRKQLLKRQKLRAEDYRADYSMRKCDDAIHQYKCNMAARETNSKQSNVRLSAVILCLENENKKNEEALTADCKTELFEVRRQIMEDYRITPSIVIDCAAPLEKECAQEAKKRGGEALHCLMKLYRESRKTPSSVLPNQCSAALMKLLHVVDPSADIRVDTVIGEACADAIHSSTCQDVAQANHGNVYPCLFHLISHPDTAPGLMTEACTERVVQLQYIVARDFTLNNQLYRACYRDAVAICKAPLDWHKSPTNNNPEQGPITFHCLYQHMRKADLEDANNEENVVRASNMTGRVSEPCRTELRQVFRMQAHRIDMNPLLYSTCMPDLMKHCATVPLREEYHCLQQNIKVLEERCKEHMVSLSEAQNDDPSLDMLLMDACLPMAKRYCKNEVTGESVALPDLMDCLIKVKNEPGMTPKCRAGVEHHQILSLEDYRISHKFHKYCGPQVTKLCSGSKTKKEILSCLSQQAVFDVLQPPENPDVSSFRLDPLCRDQLRFQLLQRSSGYILDPKLQEDCGTDVERLCSQQRDSKKGVFACLEQNRDKLSEKCHNRLFAREKLLAFDNSVDAKLMSACERMITRHCKKLGHVGTALNCLREAMHEDVNFDASCRKFVMERLKIQRLDYRLDPRMQKECRDDIKKYCQAVIDKPKKNFEYKGLVTQCLKDRFRSVEEDKQLSKSCTQYMRQVIVESNLNFHLDPILKNACSVQVRELCEQELSETDGEDGSGRVTECLKRALIAKKLERAPTCQKEVLRLLSESHADIHVDPVLYAACASELRTQCGGVPLGQGKQLMCLLQLRDDKEIFSHKFSKTCRDHLNARVEMWELSAKFAPPMGVRELVEQIHQSKERHYLIIILSSILFTIFVVGLCCGRVTKRTYVEMKNK